MFTVLDVSRWQGRIDWDTVKASGRVHGVMLRALGSRNGTPYIDPMFETNYSACIRLGIPVGVYYYSCAVTAPQRDAELALLHDALRGKRLQLPAAIDVEDARLRALTPDALSALVAGAARQLEHWGLYAMVYTYTHFADTALHMDTLAPFDLWLADYRGKRPARRHGMWQYTSRGRVSGISGPVDLSRTEKDYPVPSYKRKEFPMKKCKISPATLARTAALALALTNQVLSATGHRVLPIESAELEQLVSTGLTIATALVSWWKNNSFTPEAIEADDFLCQLKEHK